MAGVYLSERLFHPPSNLSPVGRIAENHFSRPVLRESVLLLCVVAVTLVIPVICAGIQREVEFSIQLVEQFLRR